jgi:hypothetical protein
MLGCVKLKLLQEVFLLFLAAAAVHISNSRRNCRLRFDERL